MRKKFDPEIFMASVRHEAGETTDAKISATTLFRLLNLRGEAFIRSAYPIFFNREPDPSGMGTYLATSKNFIGRIKLLAVFTFAPERKYLPPWQRRCIENVLWLVKFKWLK